MHDIAPGGLSQSPPPAGSSGDVDADGEIVGALRRRLDKAIGEVVGIEREDVLRALLDQLERTIDVAERRRARAEATNLPGVRLVDGEGPRYSAAWLDAEAGVR